MNPKPAPATRPPIEYWFFLGVALRASGLTYVIILMIGLYWMLRSARPNAGYALLTVASALVGLALSVIYLALLKPLDLHHCHELMEPIASASFVLALLFTEKRVWAWLLIIYLGLNVCLLFRKALFHTPQLGTVQFLLFFALVDLLLLWLLWGWLQKRKFSAPAN